MESCNKQGRISEHLPHTSCACSLFQLISSLRSCLDLAQRQTTSYRQRCVLLSFDHPRRKVEPWESCVVSLPGMKLEEEEEEEGRRVSGL
jgi:hypothetical protein